MVRKLVSFLLVLALIAGCAEIDDSMLLGRWHGTSINPHQDTTIDIGAMEIRFDSLKTYTIRHYDKIVGEGAFEIDQHILSLRSGDSDNKIHVLKQSPDTLWLRFLYDSLETTVTFARAE